MTPTDTQRPRTLRDLVEQARVERLDRLAAELERVRTMTAEECLGRYPIELCPRDIPGDEWADVRTHSSDGEHVTSHFDRHKPGLRCNASNWEWYARGIYSDTATPWLDLPVEADPAGRRGR